MEIITYYHWQLSHPCRGYPQPQNPILHPHTFRSLGSNLAFEAIAEFSDLGPSVLARLCFPRPPQRVSQVTPCLGLRKRVVTSLP